MKSTPPRIMIINRLIGFLEAKIDFDDKNVLNCSNDLLLTKRYLSQYMNDKKVKFTIAWLQDKGGYCDCEVLLNVASKIK